jgi:phosphoserine aminotransferase
VLREFLKTVIEFKKLKVIENSPLRNVGGAGLWVLAFSP